jgi:hypothetical protein
MPAQRNPMLPRTPKVLLRNVFMVYLRIEAVAAEKENEAMALLPTSEVEYH